MVGRRARATVIATLASLAIGAVVLRALLGPETPVFGMAGSTPVAGGSGSIPEQPVLFQAKPPTVDDAIPLGTPAVDLDKADLRIAQDSSVADQDVDGQAQLKGRADTATPATSDAAPLPTSQPDLNGVPDGVKDSDDKIFREFLQSRAVRFAAIAEPGQRPLKKKRNHSSRIVGPLATAAAQALSQGSRPYRVIPPSGRAPVGSSSRPIYPRSSVR
jgi:hypothetical protein